MQSTRQLHEELAWLSAQLEAARVLERAAEERHSDEAMAETEAALEGRREEVLGLRERRTQLLKELDRRAMTEKGWEPDRNQGGEAVPGTGRAGRLHVGPHPLLPERGYVIYDRARATVAWVRRVPTPTRAEELIREHGVLWEAELLVHGLSPVPEEEEDRR